LTLPDLALPPDAKLDGSAAIAQPTMGEARVRRLPVVQMQAIVVEAATPRVNLFPAPPAGALQNAQQTPAGGTAIR
jgi:hypothetical protein